MVPSGWHRTLPGDGPSHDRKVAAQGIATFPRHARSVRTDRALSSRAASPAAASSPAAFTERVDHRRGSVRASGHLTAQAADLLRGTVLALRSGGHPTVLLDLGEVGGADEAGLHTLETLRTTVAADGGTVLVVRGPMAGRH